MSVARTILEQLGGNRFCAMTGAKNLVDCGDALAMKIGRNKTSSNYLKITLNSMDTYDMKFSRVRYLTYSRLEPLLLRPVSTYMTKTIK